MEIKPDWTCSVWDLQILTPKPPSARGSWCLAAGPSPTAGLARSNAVGTQTDLPYDAEPTAPFRSQTVSANR